MHERLRTGPDGWRNKLRSITHITAMHGTINLEPMDSDAPLNVVSAFPAIAPQLQPFILSIAALLHGGRSVSNVIRGISISLFPPARRVLDLILNTRPRGESLKQWSIQGNHHQKETNVMRETNE